MKPIVVGQGDTVASIVAKNGGGDPDAIWNAPENADLREERGDPSILCSGDVLYIPETEPAFLPVSVGTTNKFAAPVPTQTVKLVLMGEGPLAGEPYVIHEIGPDISGTTRGDGSLSVDVPVVYSSFVLELTNRKVTPELNVTHRVLVGHLDPLDEPSGIGQRLSNMGYRSTLAPLLQPFGLTSSDGVEHRLRVFQLTNGLEPTGEADDATADAIQKSHGT